MSIPFPNKPWVDGLEFTYEVPSGETVNAKYDASKNAWSFEKSNDEISSIDKDDIFTTDVKTLGIPSLRTPYNGAPPEDITTQYDVNWFLADRVAQNQLDIDFLQQQLGGFNNIAVLPDIPNNDNNQYAFWYNTVTGQFFWWNEDNQVWLEMSAGGRNPIFSDLEPTEHPDFSPPDNALQPGDIWIDTTDPDDLFEYLYDGSQWILVNESKTQSFVRIYKHKAVFDQNENGTCHFTATGNTIDTITRVQFSLKDEHDRLKFVYNTREEIIIEDEREGATSELAVKKVNSLGDYEVEFHEGNGSASIDENRRYTFAFAAENTIIPNIEDPTYQPGTLDDRFVNKKGGD